MPCRGDDRFEGIDDDGQTKFFHERTRNMFNMDRISETELINEHLCDSLRDARNLVAAWRHDFNHHRPHSSLSDLPPWEYANRSKEAQNLNRANP